MSDTPNASNVSDPSGSPNRADGPATNCPECSITTETVATMPADRARRRIGTGEEVRCTFSLGSARWSHTGGGRLSAESGATVTYTAHDTSGSARVTATGRGCTAHVEFNVVAPSSVYMERDGEAVHSRDYPDIGMNTFVYLRPDDVSFYNVVTQEQNCRARCDGVYACMNGDDHQDSPEDLPMDVTVVDGKGTLAETGDEVRSGSCALAPANPSGSESLDITWQYRTEDRSVYHPFDTVEQRVRCEPSGRLTASKAGATAETTVSAASHAPRRSGQGEEELIGAS